MEEQLKYLLELDDSPFERDPDFSFVYYNILQKKAVCDSVRFKVKVSEQSRIIRELLDVDKSELERLIGKFKANPKYEANSNGERNLVGLVNRVGSMLHDLPGTAGYKLKMRNEIRALVNMRGTPAFFITLNPSDIEHPLVRLLSGDDIRLEQLEEGQELTDWKRRQLVARNPAACARFFHEMISNFISIVLRHGSKGRGLLGKCTAYYGTVETQGRGTLHCHMLIWLQGHPSPQEMRDNMESNTQYQNDVFKWLESIIKCELLGTSMVVKEADGPLRRPKHMKTNGYVNPGTVLGPSVVDTDLNQFEMQFASDVNDLVSHTNWHQHTETCWKHLRPGDGRTDANCRMRIDGSTHPQTSLDDETGSILLRRLHPRIASYNDVIIFLLRANMEIKHIGSGERAKALIYYVTDYITKASLPMHVGLAALLYAINRTHEKYQSVPDWENTKQASALTIVVNSMMARQEIPHQQVMSYLVGGGDHYTSDRFRILHHGSFERLVQRYWTPREILDMVNAPSAQQDNATGPTNVIANVVSVASDAVNITSDCIETLRRPDDNITLILGAGSISSVNQQQDYLYRPQTEPFNNMGLYEFIGLTEKVTVSAETRRRNRRTDTQPQNPARGRPEEPRGEFTVDHPQHGTHIVRKRTVWVVPVMLGDRIPRADRGEEEREEWARTIVTLFVPWRHPRDLKGQDESWYTAYERNVQHIAPEHMTIIHNMNVLSECKEARDKANLHHRSRPQPDIGGGLPMTIPDPFDTYAEETISREFPQPNIDDTDDLSADASLLRELDSNIGTRFRHAIDMYFSQKTPQGGESNVHGRQILVTDDLRAQVDADRATMRRLKRKRRPDDLEHEIANDTIRNTRPRLDRPAFLDTMTLGSATPNTVISQSNSGSSDPMDIVYQVVVEKNLQSNQEQLRAFEIVARHAINGNQQLLMYIGGVGGTGKSHVVNSIIRLFHLLGRSNNIRVAAPTGAAAILIGGHTIHSLTLLPEGPGRDLQQLCALWEGVDYLILDEISMVGATFLSQLNSRLQRAKGYDGTASDLPFGGVNIIFTGDFGQLRPVRDPPLYSHSLVKNPGLQNCERKHGVSALMGVYLWRQVNKVVLLKVNHRQSGDKVYADILARIRVGEANAKDTDSTPSDFNLLKTRYADRINDNAPNPSQFADAPVIVGKKKIRDLLNLRIMGHHATSISGTIHLYHSKDKIGGQPVAMSEQPALWRLTSTTTHDSLGRLPLFPGMKVMVQENLAFTNGVVNGTEGTITDILFEEDEGKRYPVVAYVHIPGAGNICTNATNDVVPIFPEWTTFSWTRKISGSVCQVNVSRLQLPLLPSYAYTDYKSQGRSLNAAIIDPSSATSLQGIYVMLSRVRALQGVCILRPFSATKIEQRLSQELRTELKRLNHLDTETRTKFPLTFAPR